MLLTLDISAEAEAQLREMAQRWASNADLTQRPEIVLGAEIKMHAARGIREAYREFKMREIKEKREHETIQNS